MEISGLGAWGYCFHRVVRVDEECFEHKTHQTAKALRKEQAGKNGVAETECEQGKGQQMGLARQQWPGCIDAEPYRSGEGF